MHRFYQIIRDFGGDILGTINNLRDVTLFVPSNAALEQPGVRQILQDKRRVKEILNLHYVKERLTIERIRDTNSGQVSRFFSYTCAQYAIKIKEKKTSYDIMVEMKKKREIFGIINIFCNTHLANFFIIIYGFKIYTLYYTCP